MAERKQYKIFPNVSLGKKVVIEPFCIIGKPPRGASEGEFKTAIGDNSIIRSGTIIYAGVRLGKNCQTGHNVLIREGNEIGDNSSVGTNSMLEPENKIGNNVRVHSGCFMESVTIEDNVFIGPCVVFTDDPHPPCPRYKDCVRGAIVKKSAKIGANCTILPGVTIKESALVGAGSVVTKDVSKGTVSIGNPAKKIKNIKELICYKGFFKKAYLWDV